MNGVTSTDPITARGVSTNDALSLERDTQTVTPAKGGHETHTLRGTRSVSTRAERTRVQR